MRLIDADAIEYFDMYMSDIKCFEKIVRKEQIDAMPTVEERKHGRWIDYPHGSGSYCSCCKFKIRYKDKKRFKSCPNCCAIMDKVSKNEKI